MLITDSGLAEEHQQALRDRVGELVVADVKGATSNGKAESATDLDVSPESEAGA